VGREVIFKSAIGNESLHENNDDDNGVRAINLATSRNLIDTVVRRPEGKKPCGIPRHRLDDNIRRDLHVVG